MRDAMAFCKEKYAYFKEIRIRRCGDILFG
jgi:hypothetical protein